MHYERRIGGFKIETNYLPKKLYYSEGGGLTLRNRDINYNDKKINVFGHEDKTIQPSKEEWNKFWLKLDELEIWSWE